MAGIEFQGVSKIYSRQSREFFWRFLIEAFGGRKAVPHYALRDISFRVSQGESLAIIGRNGAGKSTLLNLVAGITVPESGSVKVSGRVSALLELGSGFHPDLTGRENVRINAALLGLTRDELNGRMGRIIEFSEIEGSIDEPLRTYSQGMVMRLAFAVAVHVDPDIVLIDEVLAVGDRGFQRKCLDRLRKLRREGKILLCVSHLKDMLLDLCDTGLWIEAGRMMRHGPVAEVLALYEESLQQTVHPPT